MGCAEVGGVLVVWLYLCFFFFFFSFGGERVKDIGVPHHRERAGDRG